MNDEIQKELEKLFGAAGEKTKAVIKTEVAEALSKVITADELEKRLKAVSVDPKVIEKLQEAIEKQGLELTTFLEGKKNDEQTLSSVLHANKEKLQAIAKNGREAAFKIVLPASIARKTLVERSAVSSSTQAMRLTDIGQLDYVNAVIKSLFRTVQISPDSNGVIRYVDESTATRNADVKAEAAEAPESVQAWTERTLNLYKIMDSIPVTMEAFRDVNFIEGEINRLLNINMVLKEDDQLYDGSGVAPNLKGLYTSATDTLFGAGSYNQSVDNANVYDLIAALRSAMMGGNKKYSPTAVLMNPVDIFKYKVLKGTDGHYLLPPFVGPNGETVMGMRVVESAQVTANTLAVIDAKYGTIYEDGGIELEMGYVDDQFTKDTMTIKARKRTALLIRTVDEGGFFKVSNIATAIANIETP